MKASSQDIVSGFLIFLIALPLSLGIAMASGFPPIAGVLTAIIGGIISTFLGSARLTIKGPAAGLIVIMIGAVHELGQGDLVLGYKRTLAVGVAAASLQILFAVFRLAALGMAMSPAVVHGMLAAIGVIIISKQAHLVLGVQPTSTTPLRLLAEIPHSLTLANPEILVLGAVSLAILFVLPRLNLSFMKRLPAPLLVLLLAVPMGFFFDLSHQHLFSFLGISYQIGPNFLVHLPGSILSAITFPDFSVLLTAVSVKYIVMLALIGTIESTLSVIAVDALDPKRQGSDVNKDLFAVGVGNLIASFVGGLPMISEIVRSKANIDAGAKSQYSNFFHGVFLLLFVTALPSLLSQIPLACLAAMLVYTGTRLASWAELRKVSQIGYDQLLLFLVTLVTTLATDLLVGVSVGFVLKIVLHMLRGMHPFEFFKTSLRQERKGDELIIVLERTATFPCILPIRRIFSTLPADVKRVTLDVSSVRLVDHTFLTRIDALAHENKQIEFRFVGLDALRPASSHKHAARWGAKHA